MKTEVREYLSKIGAAGGSISKRKITPEQQREMQSARMKKNWENPEYRKQRCASFKGRVSPMKGKKHSLESILKQRVAHFGGSKVRQHKSGYLFVYCPDHPRAKLGRVPQQILVIENALGRFLTNDETVHHINGIKHDNSIENLQLMTKVQHKQFHAKERGLGTRIQSDPDRCSDTGRFTKREQNSTKE